MIKDIVKSLTPAPVWNKLRVIKMKWGVKNYPVEEVHHNYGGHDFVVTLKDGLARGWYNHDWERQKEIEFMSKHKLKPGARVFNFGAHQGIVAMMLAKEVAPGGEVIAYEANSHNFAMASTNRNKNSVQNLNVQHCALGETSGKLIFNEGLNGQVDDGSGAWGQVEVDAFSVDDTAKKYGTPDIVYMDVEGFEYCALRGAKETLASPSDWFIEVHGAELIGKFGGTVEETLSHFSAENFDMYMAQDEQDFVPFDISHPMVQERFFFIALRK